MTIPVSTLTMMMTSGSDLKGFNADISGWDTSGVTDMNRMFQVRSPPRTPSVPPICSRALSPVQLCGCTPQSPAPPPPPPGPHSSPRSCPIYFDHWQGATAFDQPLSWDTSGVTNMEQMFCVRCSPRFAPIPAVAQPSPVCTLRAPCARCMHRDCSPPPPSRPAARPAPRALLATNRQDAAAFDQPLSWDTSGVKIMSRMFQVRPHPRTPSVPHMQSAESLPVPRTLRVHTAGARATPPAFRGLQLAPHRAPCWRPLAGRGGLQPAAELGHLRRHKHGGHVLRAPLTAPA